MTDKETDELLVKILNNYLAEITESNAYIKSYNSKYFAEVIEQNKVIIEELNSVLKVVKTVEDLALQDEEIIGGVFEYLEDFVGNFVISATSESRKKNMEELQNLNDLLNLFYDDDEDNEDWDEDEDFE